MGLLRRIIGTASRFAGSRGRATRTRTTRRRPVRRRRARGGGLMGIVRSLMRRGGRARI